ncbi:MAG: hypothetical protein GX977_08170 [Firmicutes bacterium]|jgi:hypothetical protein|nr:hypothetical protein [Bacillota bacterium]
MYELLNQGTWTRPTDKMAIYTEIAPGQAWGIRVTLYQDTAQVEAIDGPKCARYKASPRLSAQVTPPNFWERLQGISFRDKLMEEVANKRAVAEAENSRLKLKNTPRAGSNETSR